jgi:hypothetical protein
MTLTPLSFSQVQVIWALQLAFALVCIAAGEYLRKGFDVAVNWQHGLIVALGLWSAAGGFSYRRKSIVRSAEAARNGDSSRATRHWSVGELYAFSSAVSVVGWGLVANLVVGSPRWLDAGFHVLGIGLLLAYKPTKPAFVTS